MAESNDLDKEWQPIRRNTAAIQLLFLQEMFWGFCARFTCASLRMAVSGVFNCRMSLHAFLLPCYRKLKITFFVMMCLISHKDSV